MNRDGGGCSESWVYGSRILAHFFGSLYSMRPFLLLPLVLLAACVEPYGNSIHAFAPKPPVPYSDQREQWRMQTRDQAQQDNQVAYERGISDGRADANANLPQSYQRHHQSYTPATQAAYQQGYEQGYLPPLAPMPAGAAWSPNAPPPATSVPAVGSTTASVHDPVYQQGYDYGLRDRVAGRANDPGAHTGRYDPRGRRSFERGYIDGYGSR
jgi:hypothetical protein